MPNSLEEKCNSSFMGNPYSFSSFFQSVCVLGYCVFPILLAATVILVVEWVIDLLFIINMAICGVALFWSVTCKKNFFFLELILEAAVGFMQALVPEEKKLLAVYPILLFYLSLSWFVLIASSE